MQRWRARPSASTFPGCHRRCSRLIRSQEPTLPTNAPAGGVVLVRPSTPYMSWLRLQKHSLFCRCILCTRTQHHPHCEYREPNFHRHLPSSRISPASPFSAKQLTTALAKFAASRGGCACELTREDIIREDFPVDVHDALNRVITSRANKDLSLVPEIVISRRAASR